MARDADPDLFTKILVGIGLKEDPWNHPGVTRDQAREWGKNFDNYHRPENGFKDYQGQPVERDARTTAETEVDQMTLERLHNLRQAQQPAPPQPSPLPSPQPGPAPTPPRSVQS
jgi:hypothetical protein